MFISSLFASLSALSLGAPPPAAPAVDPAVTDAALVEQLADCADEECPAFVGLRDRGPGIWTTLLPVVAPPPDAARPPKELTRFWAIGLCAAHRHKPCAEPLKRILAVGGEARLRAASAYALARVEGPGAADALHLALTDGDVNVRFEAASAIADLRLGDDATVTALVAALGDTDGDVRRAAIEALGLGGNPKAVSPLGDRLVRETIAMNRGFAAIALGQLKARAASERLIGRLTAEDDPEALAAAAWALGEVGDPAAVKPLEALSAHADERVRESATAALAQLKRVPEKAPRELPKTIPEKVPPRLQR